MFRAFLFLGLTSFGGPVAHLGYCRAEFVARRRWLDETTFFDLAALNQFLPGPTSSRTGFAIGLMRAGLPGAFAAWIGFTLPSAAIVVALGLGLVAVGGVDAVWLSGLRVAALAIVARAVWAMAVQPNPAGPAVSPAQPLPGRDLRARLASSTGSPVRTGRRQRGCRRPAAGRPLRSGLDLDDPRAARLRARGTGPAGCGPPAALGGIMLVAGAALTYASAI